MKSEIKKADSIVTRYLKETVHVDERVGVLLSGGIDSSVITSYVVDRSKLTCLLSMGTSQTKDRPYCELMSNHLGRPIDWVELDDQTISDSLVTVKGLLIRANIEPSLMQISLGIGYYLLFKRASEMGITKAITGQGPDILFAGYNKYKTTSDIDRQIRLDLPLLEVDKKRDSAMASVWGVALINPYLSNEFVAFALSVPARYKLANGVEKVFMREWGRWRGLPDEIVGRPKKAFQYSTGLQRKIKNLIGGI